MPEVSNAIKQLVSADGVEQFRSIDQIGDKIDNLSEVSILEKNLLKRCVVYDLFPEAVFENESAANRNTQRIATALIKRHGIEEKVAQNIAIDICTGFSQDGIRISMFKEDSTPPKQSSSPRKDVAKEDKPKKKGLFSFFKRG